MNQKKKNKNQWYNTLAIVRRFENTKHYKVLKKAD